MGVAAATVLLAASAAGCGVLGVQGEGPVVTEPRDVAEFGYIEVGNGIGLSVTIGEPSSVEVRAQDNLLPLILTDVEDATLVITSNQGFTTSEGVEVAVVMSSLEGLTMSGGSAGQVDGLEALTLAISMSGGSTLRASGTTDGLDLDVGGGSRAELEELQASTVAIDLSGGANVTIVASDSVSGTASGGASLTVLGGATLDVESSGGASVQSP